MGVTRARKSSITNSEKRTDAGAGNLMYPWFGAWGDMLGSNPVIENMTTSGYTLGLDKVVAFQTQRGDIQLGITNGGPPNYGSYNGGKTFLVLPSGNYGQILGSFNGTILNGSNYIGSSSWYSNDLSLNGWTKFGTDGSGYSFGTGAGGWVHQNFPLWAIPYTYNGVHYVRWIAGSPGSYGVPSTSWSDTSVNTASGGGYASKVAVIGSPTTYGGYGTVYYAGYNNNTLSTGAFFMRAVAYSGGTSVNAIISNVVTPPAITGLMQSFVSLGETLILSTADNKLYTSTDGGGTWVTRTSPFAGTSALAISCQVAGRVIASSANTGISPKYYQSADGATWTEFANFSPPINSASNGVATTENGFAYITYANGSAGVRLKGFAG